MPELPEVETVIRDLRAAGLAGTRICLARVLWPKTVAAPGPSAFVRRIRDRDILGLDRRGKFILVSLSGGQTLVVHLRMTGRLQLAPPGPPGPYDRVILALANGTTLRFADPRKFGRVWLVPDPVPVLARLGPEPLSISRRDFAARLAARSRALKALLLDQSFVAGLGNIYADEALWTARLHPLRNSATLSPAEAAALHRAVQTVLRRGIRNLGTSLGHGKTNFRLPRGEAGRNREHLHAYGQTGLPCTRCRTPIVRIIAAQRATHFCSACQRRPDGPPFDFHL